VITLGGDGTLLHASSLFQSQVPPILSFSLGSLGFLVPFNFDDFQNTLSRILIDVLDPMPVLFRMRLAARYSKTDPSTGERITSPCNLHFVSKFFDILIPPKKRLPRNE
jgi:NADH kinase